MGNILIIDDDIASCRTLQLHFQTLGHNIRVTHSVENGLSDAQKHTPDLIILDIRMPDRDGLDGLPEFKQLHERTPVIMITAFDDMESTIQAMKRGADDYIRKPIDINELDAAVINALDHVDSEEQPLIKTNKANLKPGNTMVGRSKAMQEVFKTIGLVAPKPVTVLITGESGTGKELVARAIHQASANPGGPFVAINCAALVDTLLESELFGHEKGAFTGAVSRQTGKFELANNGTIFLDEVGELSPTVQAKLLRVLQEKEFIPLGGNKTYVTNARVVAATNEGLLEKIHSGTFREDLFYRLQVVNIHIPPLRERKMDLDELVPTLLERINREMHHASRVIGVTKDSMAAINNYNWPGNIRELENVLLKAAALCQGSTIRPDLLPETITKSFSSSGNDNRIPDTQLSLQEVEKSHVTKILNATNWHRGKACEILGVSRPRLRRLIAQFGLVNPNKNTGNDTEDSAD